MTVAILTLLGAIIPFGIWLWKRRASRVDDPAYQHEKRVQEADKAIADGNADSINRQLESDLRRLQKPDRDSR